MHRFTSEFGKGSGGSNALWSSSNSGGEPVSSRFPEWICDWYFAVQPSFRLVFTKQQIVWVLYGQASRAISIG